MENNFEMIICIVNAGFSGDVMDVARKEGSKGGTIMHARGTANIKAEKMFSINVNPEKDMIFMVVPKSISEKIITAIYNEVGLTTEAQAIAFTVPVTNQVGIKT